MFLLKSCLKLYFFLTIQTYILGVQSACDTTQSLAVATRLRQKILCGYDREAKPVKVYQNTTSVVTSMRLMFLTFKEESNSLQIHSWTRYSWNDEFLKWNKSDYEGIDYLKIQPSLIWLPDMAIHTPSEIGESFLQIANRLCWITSIGRVTCVVPTMYSAYCAANIRLWPFDTHNCSMRIGSWTAYTDQMNVTVEGSGVTFEKDHGFMQVGDWTMLNGTAVSQSYKLANRSSPYVNYSFVLKRNSGVFASTVIVPSIVLAILTTAVFWLDSNSPERIGLMCLNILCHCLYMQYLGANLPSNGEVLPVILVFFRDSFIMVIFSLLITLVIRGMEGSTTSPPSFVTLIVNGVLNTSPGQLLLLGEVDPTMRGAFNRSSEADEASLVDTPSKFNVWRLFAIFLDRMAFISFSIGFVVLLTKFSPSE